MNSVGEKTEKIEMFEGKGGVLGEGGGIKESVIIRVHSVLDTVKGEGRGE